MRLIPFKDRVRLSGLPLIFLMKRMLLDIDDLKVSEGSEGMFSIDELSQEEKVRLVD